MSELRFFQFFSRKMKHWIQPSFDCGPLSFKSASNLSMTPTQGGIRRITQSFLQWNSRHFVTLRLLENEIMNDLRCDQATWTTWTTWDTWDTCEHVRTRADTWDTKKNKNSGTHVISRDSTRDITWYHVASRDHTLHHVTARDTTWHHVMPRDRLKMARYVEKSSSQFRKNSIWHF